MKLLFALLGDVCISVIIAYLLGRSKKIMSYAQGSYNIHSWLIFTVIFSTLSIVSSYYGTRIEGALASTRIVGTLMGGLIGGPYVGMAVGIIGGLHRYSLGGFTAASCAVATAIAGLMAGFVRHRIGFNQLNWKVAAAVAFAAEFIQKAFTLIFAKPFEAAYNFEVVALVPTTAVTVVGTVLFVLIMKDMENQIELAGAKASKISLDIATETLPYLKDGLNLESAQKTAEIICKLSGADAVAISDTKLALGFAGINTGKHYCNHPITYPITLQVLETGNTITFHDGPFCGDPNCPLTHGIVVPLTVEGTPVGTIRFYKTKKAGLSPVDIQMAEGVARLLSTQIALAEAEKQRALREEAEFKALQAQINPHFLFNTLSIIMSFCRTDPDMARELLANLSEMLHFNFAPHEDKVPLAEEFDSVEAYLNIVKARFGSRLTINMDLDEELEDCLVPTFSLQPIVENAVKHGLFPKTEDCCLTIKIFDLDEQLVMQIIDNGIGMSQEKCQQLMNLKSKGIGVANVMKRIKGLYKEAAEINVTSEENVGTTFTIIIPLERGTCHES